MQCRTSRDQGRRPISARCRRAAPPAPTTPYGRAADLVLRIAALIPAPSTGLTRDDAAWSAFSQLVDEAAQVLVEALGHEGLPALRALAGTPVTAHPVCSLLVERGVATLTATAHNG